MKNKFLELRKKAISVNDGFYSPWTSNYEWFLPWTQLNFSDHWFGQFSKTKTVSLKKAMHKSQKDPAYLGLLVQQFHAKLLWERKREN